MMKRLHYPKLKLMKVMSWAQIILLGLVILVTISSLYRFYSAGVFLHNEEIICKQFSYANTIKNDTNHNDEKFDAKALSNRVEEVLEKLDSLQEKLESAVQQMDKNKELLAKTSMKKSEHKKYLEQEVIRPLYEAHIALRQIRLPRLNDDGGVGLTKEDPLINAFVNEEIRKYITPKQNRPGSGNGNASRDIERSPYGTTATINTIGHACGLSRKELEQYMDYDVGSYCDDDWDLGQKLMLAGCDPLPRRRCLARASKVYQKPYPINESLWKIPDDRNVRWGKYRCRNFRCLSSDNFNLDKERLRWTESKTKGHNSSLPIDFTINEVLGVKPREVRIGVDIGVVGTGSFAAKMREHDVTIISTAMNIDAPFSETIALRGLVPLYATANQRLPFFDNTMDLIHTSGFLAGWVDLVLMDFVLYDWDRVLRPGGLLWVDRFYCKRKELDDFMYMFLQFRYKKHRWAIAPKSKDEVYFSALLEKPPRAI